VLLAVVLFACSLFADAPAEPGFAGRVKVVDGRPRVMANDRALTTSYCDRFPHGDMHKTWLMGVFIS
jgi:hypothetical protein